MNICFVNCHLAAHHNETERRIQVGGVTVVASVLVSPNLVLSLHNLTYPIRHDLL